MSSKKAQGLPLNVIAIAAILIIVLIVLVLIFTRQAGEFNKATNECEVRGGVCLPKGNCKGAMLNIGCDGMSREVFNGIEYVTLGREVVCCLEIGND
ncbi:hypothetical protein DRJ48_00450 [Candidatus Woesearchaeota archaeon]|nr:hypothetical protein [Candidatus Woesearchaeota archaeon]RLE43632.1 MAG: hypothetical protein DRJ48_00450 [Candidatus Woesearchaeota archaeon]